MKDVICNVQSEIFKVKCAEQFAELNLESKICRVEYADCNLQYAECKMQSAMCRVQCADTHSGFWSSGR